MAPLEGNRDVTASSKAYAHLSPTPTQKHRVQNMFHAHHRHSTVHFAPSRGRGAPNTEPLGKPLNSAMSSSVVVLLMLKLCLG